MQKINRPLYILLLGVWTLVIWILMEIYGLLHESMFRTIFPSSVMCGHPRTDLYDLGFDMLSFCLEIILILYLVLFPPKLVVHFHYFTCIRSVCAIVFVFLLSEATLQSYPVINTLLQFLRSSRGVVAVLVVFGIPQYCARNYSPSDHLKDRDYHSSFILLALLIPMVLTFFFLLVLIVVCSGDSFSSIGECFLVQPEGRQLISPIWLMLISNFMIGISRLRTSWWTPISESMNSMACFFMAITSLFLSYFYLLNPTTNDPLSQLFLTGSTILVSVAIPLCIIVSLYLVPLKQFPRCSHDPGQLAWLSIYHSIFSIYWRMICLGSHDLFGELYAIYHSLSALLITLTFFGP